MKESEFAKAVLAGECPMMVARFIMASARQQTTKNGPMDKVNWTFAPVSTPKGETARAIEVEGPIPAGQVWSTFHPGLEPMALCVVRFGVTKKDFMHRLSVTVEPLTKG